MPPSHSRWKEIDEKLEADHLARIVQRQVGQLGPQALHELYRGAGKRAFDPVAILQMVLYMKLKKIHSPAQWHEEARLNEAVQWLGYGYQPARRTWYDFRDRMEKYIDCLNDQLIQGAIEEGDEYKGD